MNTSSLIALTVLNYWFGRGGVVKEGGEVDEVGNGVSGGDNCGMRCLIKLTALGENQARSWSLARGGEIIGLFPNPLKHLQTFLLYVIPLINVFASPVFHITTS